MTTRAEALALLTPVPPDRISQADMRTVIAEVHAEIDVSPVGADFVAERAHSVTLLTPVPPDNISAADMREVISEIYDELDALAALIVTTVPRVPVLDLLTPIAPDKISAAEMRTVVNELYDEIDALLAHGPKDIQLSNLTVPELTDGAVVGIVTVVDIDLPADEHTFTVSDSRFEVANGILKIKDGQQVDFATTPSVALTIEATDRTALKVAVSFTISVIEQVVPDTNHAPTNVLLDNLTVQDLTLGAIVGNVTAVDPDLPNDTIILTVDDPRFVIIAGELQLLPNKFISGLREPIVSVTLTATDAGGLSASHTHTIAVTGIAAPNLSNGIFMAPAPLGSGDGSSFANAMAFSNITTAIAQAAATGKQVLMASDLGNYVAGLRILTAGGVAGAPVIIRGVNADGAEEAATIVGTRGNPWTPAAATGEEVFRLLAGANHLYFKNIDFRNCGLGCFRVGASISDLVIDTCNSTNVGRFIENGVSGAETVATLTGLRVRNCLMEGCQRSFLRTQYDSNDILVEGCFGDSLGQDGGSGFAVGISFEGTTHNVDVIDTTMRNNHDIVHHIGPPTSYQNADGLSSEAGTYDIRLTRFTASGNTDGGIDMKGGTVALPHVLTAVTCFDNKLNFKFWGHANATDCVGLDPNLRGDEHSSQSQVQVNSATGVVTLTNCHFADNSPGTTVFDLGADAVSAKTLTVVNTSVQKNAGATLLSNPNGATATLDVVAAPNNTAVPILIAATVAGQTIALGTPGTWDEAVTPFYKYKRDGVPIDDALGPNYASTSDDIGHLITIAEYAADADGNIGEAVSASVGPITASTLANTVAPSLSGPPFQGGTLVADVGSWDGIPAPTFVVAFKLNGAAVQTGASLLYAIQAADVGKTPKITVTADNGTGAVSVDSANYTVIGAQLAVGYFAPTAQGTGIGSSWANAAGYFNLNGLLGAMAPDGIVYGAAHLGTYAHGTNNPLHLTHGGTTGHPVTIQMAIADLTPTDATIIGSRFSWTYPALVGGDVPRTNVAGLAVGGDIIWLMTGASHLAFRNIVFQDCGNCITVKDDIADLTIDDCDGDNVRRFFEGDSGNSLTGLLMQDAEIIGYSKSAIRMRGASSGWVLNNVHCDSAFQDGDSFAVGCQVSENAHDFTDNSCHYENNRQQLTSTDFWNGDGFSSEAGNYDITHIDTESNGNADAGFDHKCLRHADGGITCLRTNSHDNRANYKNWGGIPANIGINSADFTFTDVISHQPHKRGGSGAIMHFEAAYSADLYIKGNSVITDAGEAGAGVYVSESYPAMFRVGSLVSETCTLQRTNFSAGTVLRDAVNEADVTAPTITSSASPSYPEELPVHHALTADSQVTWRFIGGTDLDSFAANFALYTNSTLSMPSPDFEVPGDANGDNVYQIIVEAVDNNRNVTQQTINLTITDVDETAIDSDAQAYFDAMAVPLSVDNKATVNAWVRGLKFDDLWDRCSHGRLILATQQQSLIDPFNPATAQVIHGTVAFTAFDGFQGSSGGYISSPAFATIDVGLGRANLQMFVDILTELAVDFQTDFGVANSNNIDLNSRNAAGNIHTRADASSFNDIAASGSIGFVGWGRTTSTLGYIARNGVVLTTSLASPAADPLPNGLVTWMQRSGGQFSTRKQGAAFVLKGLSSAEHLKFYNRLQTLKAALE